MKLLRELEHHFSKGELCLETKLPRIAYSSSALLGAADLDEPLRIRKQSYIQISK